MSALDAWLTHLPAEVGFHMPAEWEPHRATWLAWPHNPETWPGRLERAEAAYARMVRTLAEVETVHIEVGAAATERRAVAALRRAGARGDIRLHHIPTNDAWVRDHGPTFVWTQFRDADVPPSPSSGEEAAADLRERLLVCAVAAIDWVFNCWGGKYPPFDLDAEAGRRIADTAGVPRLAPPLVLEGGAIEVDGAGRAMLTESSVLNPNRNPALSRDAIERALRRLLGVERFVWLPGGIAGDDTDGHIDDVARFVAPGRVVIAVERDAGDANFMPLQANRAALERHAREDGLEVIELPMPPAILADGNRLPASYANFYIANQRVIVPTFGVPHDARALAILREQFPHHDVIGLDAADIVPGLGAWHCLTQQVPAAAPPERRPHAPAPAPS